MILITLINLYDPIINFNNNRKLDANAWGNQVPIFKVLFKQNAKFLFHMSLHMLSDTNVLYTRGQINITTYVVTHRQTMNLFPLCYLFPSQLLYCSKSCYFCIIYIYTFFLNNVAFDKPKIKLIVGNAIAL